MIQEAIGQLVAGQALSQAQAAQVMDEIMSGEATPAQFGAFVTALRIKGETADEVAGMAQGMRDKSNRVEYTSALVDTCGTGGDASGSFNVSTAAAFVIAASGLRVAKHGNRAMTSQSGSADVLEALGVKLELTPEQVRRCIDEASIGFMFAPAFHPAMRFAAGPRREIGIRTVFNILGPLTNPAGATHQLLGVADSSLGRMMAEVLLRLGSVARAGGPRRRQGRRDEHLRSHSDLGALRGQHPRVHRHAGGCRTDSRCVWLGEGRHCSGECRHAAGYPWRATVGAYLGHGAAERRWRAGGRQQGGRPAKGGRGGERARFQWQRTQKGR